jgi:hypothetical protein
MEIYVPEPRESPHAMRGLKLRRNELYVFSFVGVTTFGAVHCRAAWSFHFPSDLAKLLWRAHDMADLLADIADRYKSEGRDRLLWICPQYIGSGLFDPIRHGRWRLSLAPRVYCSASIQVHCHVSQGPKDCEKWVIPRVSKR